MIYLHISSLWSRCAQRPAWETVNIRTKEMMQPGLQVVNLPCHLFVRAQDPSWETRVFQQHRSGEGGLASAMSPMMTAGARVTGHRSARQPATGLEALDEAEVRSPCSKHGLSQKRNGPNHLVLG